MQGVANGGRMLAFAPKGLLLPLPPFVRDHSTKVQHHTVNVLYRRTGICYILRECDCPASPNIESFLRTVYPIS